MAEYDGEVVLKAKLTVEDIKKTSKQLQGDLNQMFNAASGKKTSAAFKKLESSAAKLSQKVSDAYAKVEKLGKVRGPVNLSNDIKDAQKELDELKAKASKNGEALFKPTEQAEKLKNELAGARKEAKEAEKALGAYKSSALGKFDPKPLDPKILKTYEDAAQSARDKVASLDTQLRELRERGEHVELTPVGKQIDELENKIKQLKEGSDSAVRSLDNIGDSKVPTKEYIELRDNLASARKELASVNKQIENSTESTVQFTNECKNLLSKIAELRKSRKQANKELTAYKTSNMGKFDAEPLDPKKLEEYEQRVKDIDKELETANEELRKLQETGNAVSLGPLQEQAKNLEAYIESATKKMASLEESGDAYEPAQNSDEYNKAIQTLDEYNDKLLVTNTRLREVGRAEGIFKEPLTLMQRLSRTVGKVANAIGIALVRGLRKAATAAGRLALNLGKAVGGAIKKRLSEHINKLKEFAKSLTSLKDKFNLFSKSADRGGFSLSKFIRYGLGISSLFVLFNRLRNAIADGFTAMAEYSPAFAQTIADFKAALTSLKNSFGAAFAPIASVVLPLLTALINRIADAVNMIGMLISALMGKKSYTKAITGVSGAVGGIGDAASGANEEAKELQKTLSGFDDVNILQENKDASGAGGGGGAGGGAGTLFEDVTVGSEFEDLAKMIKEAWEKADFTEIGTIVGTKIRDALDSIPWDKIKEVLRKVAKSIATFLNGFLETPGLFSTIGKTVAEAINSAFEFLDSFVWNFHWGSLGTAIKDAVISAANNLDWKTIKSAFTGLASGIATAINNTLTSNEFWSAIFTTIAEWKNTLVSSIHRFIKDTKWYEIGSALGTGISDGIKTYNWAEKGATLADALNALVQFLKGLLEKTDFKALAHGIATSIVNFFGRVDWKEFGGTLKKALSALGTFLGTLADDLDLKGLGKALVLDIFDNARENALLEMTWWQTAFPAHLYNALAAGINKYLIPELNRLFNAILDPWGLMPDIEIPFLPTIENPEKVYQAMKNTLEAQNKKSNLQLWAEGLLTKFNISPQAQKDLSVESLQAEKLELKNPKKNAKVKVTAEVTQLDNNIPKDQLEIESTAKYNEVYNFDAKQTRMFASSVDESKYLERQNNTTSTKILNTKGEDRITGARALMESIKDSNATKALYGIIGASFTSAKTVYDTVLNKDATVKTWGSIQNTFNTAKTSWDSVKDKSTTAKIYGAIQQAFTSTKNVWDAVKNKDAWVTAKGKLDNNTWSKKGSPVWTFNNTKDKNVTAKMASKYSGSGDKTNINTFYNLKDKNVKAIFNQMVNKLGTPEFTSRAYMYYLTNALGIPEFSARAIVNRWSNNVGSIELSATAVLQGVRSNVRGYTYASGGIINANDFINSIPHYATGTTKVHGSLFLAGESGPEVLGHVGGRTEVLNRFQLASTMFTAITEAFRPLVSGLQALFTQQGGFISQTAESISNILSNPIPVIIDSSTIDRLMDRVNIPAVVTGHMIPYETRLAAVEDKVNSIQPSDVTVDELRAIRDDIVNAINKVQFYIGDEQVARHANAGNQLLNRRFSATAQGV